jgi:hypothetical protein
MNHFNSTFGRFDNIVQPKLSGGLLPSFPYLRQGTHTGLAKVAVQCSAETFVVNQTLVLRINICGENRHLRQARNR